MVTEADAIWSNDVACLSVIRCVINSCINRDTSVRKRRYRITADFSRLSFHSISHHLFPSSAKRNLQLAVLITSLALAPPLARFMRVSPLPQAERLAVVCWTQWAPFRAASRLPLNINHVQHSLRHPSNNLAECPTRAVVRVHLSVTWHNDCFPCVPLPDATWDSGGYGDGSSLHRNEMIHQSRANGLSCESKCEMRLISPWIQIFPSMEGLGGWSVRVGGGGWGGGAGEIGEVLQGSLIACT